MVTGVQTCALPILHVKRGDIYGFIGKNGAGKTTTMKLILGLINPSEGEITLFGSKDLNKQRDKIIVDLGE